MNASDRLEQHLAQMSPEEKAKTLDELVGVAKAEWHVDLMGDSIMDILDANVYLCVEETSLESDEDAFHGGNRPGVGAVQIRGPTESPACHSTLLER